ncbi:cinnamoyl-CoA reductase 1 [Amborella trichopoda]|nr:cinnamoyl-CoA reductase 1 [Amborella trichopoda]|eukprot:XP_006847421.2 cinnamoyl-CoA reductase 1 [Amborella trichopoda]
MTREETVCVTGGIGFIGSTLVRLLLDRGYTVRATVQDLKNEKETKHLQGLEGAESRLSLFQVDLLNYDSLFAAIDGAVGVFHLASPCIVDQIRDPKRELLEPAVEGTLNALRACKAAGVKRVVVTSSNCAIVPSPNYPDDAIKNEDCWTDLDYCKQNGIWYPASKTLAEKAAWDFAKEEGLDVVVINPGAVFGPILPPTIDASLTMLLRLLQGCTEGYKDLFMGAVHVNDVALGHILLYENPSASGRNLCIESICHWSDFAVAVAKLYPGYKVPRFTEVTQFGFLRAQKPSKKLIDLGLNFIPMEEIIKDAVSSLQDKGYLS